MSNWLILFASFVGCHEGFISYMVIPMSSIDYFTLLELVSIRFKDYQYEWRHLLVFVSSEERSYPFTQSVHSHGFTFFPNLTFLKHLSNKIQNRKIIDPRVFVPLVFEWAHSDSYRESYNFYTSKICQKNKQNFQFYIGSRKWNFCLFIHVKLKFLLIFVADFACIKVWHL